MVKKIILGRKVRLEITDPEPEVMLMQLTDAGVLLEDITCPDGLHICLSIPQKNLERVYAIVKKRGNKCKPLRKHGLLWELTSLRQRPVLLLGGVIFLLVALLLPGRILRIDVTGNKEIPQRQILVCAESSGLQFGSLARSLRSENIKNQILGAIPELQWIGINLRGCVAIIQVEERDIPPAIEESSGVSSIVASRDGIISDLVVHSGNALCAPGQSVNEGEVLISGYSDQGLKVTATVAHGEVFAFTRRDLQVLRPAPTVIQREIREKHTCYRLKIGKKVINFCNHSGISDATCDKMYLEYYWALPGGFRLPVSLIKETCSYYELQAAPENVCAPQWLEAESEAYLCDQMIAGEILQRDSSIEVAADFYRLRGIYFCREMIGTVRYEEIQE